MNIALGFGSTETEFENAEGDAFVNFVTEAYRNETCGYFSDEFVKKVEEWVRVRSGELRAASIANDRSDDPPSRYSHYYGYLTQSASHLVLVANFMHINRRHALSPDGWALLRNERLFHVAASDLEASAHFRGTGMNTKTDGGPAFPRSDERGPDGVGIMEGTSGMTLRDWFAGQALAGMHARDTYDEGQRAPEQRARLAYIDADAMLAERAKSTGEQP